MHKRNNETEKVCSGRQLASPPTQWRYKVGTKLLVNQQHYKTRSNTSKKTLPFGVGQFH